MTDTGLKFAEKQLLRHGWEHGKGLGKTENGITEAIKVKLKCDKAGIGHKEGEQFTFHWWDHVFNKASSSLQVESDQTGIKLKKTTEEAEDNGLISNKKPRKAMVAKAKLYGSFVKSATLLSGQEQPEPKPSQSDDSSSSDDEEEKLDLSSTTKLPDADLMKACGGRTAHKGARHGLTMSAKLARLEQQEAEFMAKYGKKSQTSVSAATLKSSQSAEQTSEATLSDPPRKKKKKSSGNSKELNGDVSENPETGVKLKKKKRQSEKAEEITETDVMCVENNVDDSDKTKRKHKKKKGNIERNEEEQPLLEEMSEPHTDAKKKKRKKKKTSKHQSEEEESNDTESPQSEAAEDCGPETRAGFSLEEAEVAEQSTVKQKRKRCKKDKPHVDHSLNDEQPRQKKKKKKKESKELR